VIERSERSKLGAEVTKSMTPKQALENGAIEADPSEATVFMEESSVSMVEEKSPKRGLMMLGAGVLVLSLVFVAMFAMGDDREQSIGDDRGAQVSGTPMDHGTKIDPGSVSEHDFFMSWEATALSKADQDQLKLHNRALRIKLMGEQRKYDRQRTALRVSTAKNATK
jgi:hypothetical protein